jgi:hypothetical protein
MPRTRDWHSPEAADAPKGIDRSGLAWEFLRRNPEFREHYTSILERIESNALSEEAALAELSDRWGCLILRAPSLPASSGSMIWRPELLALGVTLVTAPDCYSEAHELSGPDVDHARADLRRADGRHILLEDAERDHSLWLPNPDFSYEGLDLPRPDNDCAGTVVRTSASLARFARMRSVFWGSPVGGGLDCRVFSAAGWRVRRL